ncbi:MAG: hypothetical protein ABSG36_08045 [Acidimicrobiales bacterium]|jgi:hypothetical protein
MPTIDSKSDASVSPIDWFVAEMGENLRLGERPVDRRRRRALQLITKWATAQGLPLDREAILDPAMVERFCEVALSNGNTRATLRSDLRHMAPLLTKSAPWEPRPVAIAKRQLAPPYGAFELEVLRHDALDQPTPARRRAARALLALGLGAGLDGRWLAQVGPDDVTCVDGVVEIAVGEPAPRRVVVVAEWENEVLDLAETASDGCLLGTRSDARNRVADLAKSLVRPAGHPRLSPGRLRSTWLLGHLSTGTRVTELCQAAGLRSLLVLSDLMVFVEQLDDAAVRTLLRRGQL